MKIVLVGGHPKGFPEPFNIKTKSGKVLRKIVSDIDIDPIFFDLWENQEQQDNGIISSEIKEKIKVFNKNGYIIVALGRFAEKALNESSLDCNYLPHPASRDAKFIKQLKSGLKRFKNKKT
jgi:hypothetical protein